MCIRDRYKDGILHYSISKANNARKLTFSPVIYVNGILSIFFFKYILVNVWKTCLIIWDRNEQRFSYFGHPKKTIILKLHCWMHLTCLKVCVCLTHFVEVAIQIISLVQAEKCL